MIPREIFEETLLGFFGPIRPYLEDDTVAEVMINGPDLVYVERAGRIERVPVRFAGREQLLAALRNLAQYVGRHFDEQRPILEAHLPDGSRVEAIIPPAAPDGPNIAIRRFFRNTLTIERLIELGSLTRDAAETLRALVLAKQNIIVAGGTASGKTSLLNALSSFAAPSERIVVIEDSRELQLQQTHVVHLEAQPGDERGRGIVTIRDLFRATLRLRPDRIVVGEIRGGESLDLIQAMTSGHGGCMSTVHATHTLDTVNRLETMALMSDVRLPLYALRSQVASAIDVVVHSGRTSEGFRCVTGISEVCGYDEGKGYRFRDLFRRRWTDHGSVFEPTGLLPSCTEALLTSGVRLPPAVIEAAHRLHPEELSR